MKPVKKKIELNVGDIVTEKSKPKNNDLGDQVREVLSKVLIDGQNQIHDLKNGSATPEEITERMFASLDYWTPKVLQEITGEIIAELERLHRLEPDGSHRDYDNVTDELIDERVSELKEKETQL